MDLTTLTQVKALLELTEADWNALVAELIGAKQFDVKYGQTMGAYQGSGLG